MTAGPQPQLPIPEPRTGIRVRTPRQGAPDPIVYVDSCAESVVLGIDDQGHRTSRQPAPVDVHVLLTDLYQHDQHGYGRWGAGLRHRVQTALGWHDHQGDRS